MTNPQFHLVAVQPKTEADDRIYDHARCAYNTAYAKVRNRADERVRPLYIALSRRFPYRLNRSRWWFSLTDKFREFLG